MLRWRTGESLRFPAGGAELEAHCWGPPPAGAPTLVLLHEGLGSVGLWRDFPAALAAATGWGVFAWSRAGYGRSDPCALPRPLDYLTDEAVRVLPEVLDRIGLRRGVAVGHSDGATIAALHAGLVGDPRVAAIVLMAPHFFVEPVCLAALAEVRRAYESGGLRERLARHHDHVDVAFHGWNDAWLDPRRADWDVRAVLEGIRVPALAIQGEDDRYGTRAQLAALEQRVPAPVTAAMFGGCGHAPFREQPERTLGLIAAFLAGLPGG